MEACVSGARADSRLHGGFLVVVRSWWIGSDELKEEFYTPVTRNTRGWWELGFPGRRYWVFGQTRAEMW